VPTGVGWSRCETLCVDFDGLDGLFLNFVARFFQLPDSYLVIVFHPYFPSFNIYPSFVRSQGMDGWMDEMR